MGGGRKPYKVLNTAKRCDVFNAFKMLDLKLLLMMTTPFRKSLGIKIAYYKRSRFCVLVNAIYFLFGVGVKGTRNRHNCNHEVAGFFHTHG